jgi:ATP-binding cassette subfamily B protein
MFILIIFRDFQTIKYIMLRPFPFYIQADSKDYGSTCLKIFANHFGKILNIQTLPELSETTREGEI